MLEFFVFAAIGKTLMYVWNYSPYSEFLSKRLGFFEKLFGCDLCFGAWVYSFLALFVPEANPFIVLVDDWVFRPLVGMIIYLLVSLVFGVLTSFLVHVFSIGWNSKFQTIVIK